MTTGIKKVISAGVRILFTLYMLVGATVFVPYYNWEYAHENGFLCWVLFGEFVPTLKGAAWPYLLIVDRNASRESAEASRGA